MEKRRRVKKLSLYSSEATTLLTDPYLYIVSCNEERFTVEDTTTASTISSSCSSKVYEEIDPLNVHCTSCLISFTDREHQVHHYSLDWHRHNLKRKLKGLSPLSQDEFEKQADDLSSISGSDSDRDSKDKISITGSPLLIFTTDNITYHGIYKVLITNIKDIETLIVTDIKHTLINLTQGPQLWIILMRSGGHFAGAVFKGSTVLDHKTFHRYTVRAKRGTIQSSRDSHHGGHKPKSAGASLRRYNESALEHEIDELIFSWKHYIDVAELIFIKAPKHTKNPFFNGKNSPIIAGDSRIRRIPFVTRRPTFSEIKSVHISLAAVYSGIVPHRVTDTKVTETPPTETPPIETLPTETLPIETPPTETLPIETPPTETLPIEVLPVTCVTKPKKRKKKVKIENDIDPLVKTENDIDPLVIQLHNYCRENKVEELLKLLNEIKCSLITIEPSASVPIEPLTSVPIEPSASVPIEPLTSVPIEPLTSVPIEPSTSVPIELSTNVPIEPSTNIPEFDINSMINSSTALHVASSLGHVDIIKVLLQYGANPTLKDQRNKVPYVLAKDKATRDCFRRFMSNYPQAYDYSEAQIPSELTHEMELVRREKKSEKRKQQKKLQKEKKAETQLIEEIRKSEVNHSQKIKELSEREKRALAAEKRIASQMPPSDIAKYGHCSWCGMSLYGVIPFERLQYRYCKIECVREHRQSNN